MLQTACGRLWPKLPFAPYPKVYSSWFYVHTHEDLSEQLIPAGCYDFSSATFVNPAQSCSSM